MRVYLSQRQLRSFTITVQQRVAGKNIHKLGHILDYIDSVDELPPSHLLFRAHEYKGKGKGTWSFDITGNMRVLCEFDEDIDAINIRIDDLH